MEQDSNIALYLGVFFLVFFGLMGWLLYAIMSSQGRRAETLRRSLELRDQQQKRAQEQAATESARREAEQAFKALQALNSPDREERAKLRAVEQEKVFRQKTLEMQVATERMKLKKELTFEQGDQPVSAYVAATAPRTIDVPDTNTKIVLKPGSYRVRFAFLGEPTPDPKVVTGVSCNVVEVTWEFVDKTGRVWELYSYLNGEFFSQFSVNPSVASMKEKELGSVGSVFRPGDAPLFIPTFEYWTDATKSIRELFLARGLVQGLCSGTPPDSGSSVKIWKVTLPLNPKSSWVCHDLAWNINKNEVIIRDYGWVNLQGGILPIFHYSIPLKELCPLTWPFSHPSYTGDRYRDFVLNPTDRTAEPQPEIEVIE